MLNRPVLDYLVDDCIAAGITNIVLVVREGQELVKHYYTEQPALRAFFERMGTAKKYTVVEGLHQKATFHFLVQKDEDGYGTGVPVRLAEDLLKDEPAFLFLTGDDFMYHANGGSEAAALAACWEKTGAGAVMSCRQVDALETHRYGIVETEETGGMAFLKSMIEKPAQGTTSSTLANISKYVLTPAIFPLLHNQGVNSDSGELYITDTVSALSKTMPVAVHVPDGEYLDCGSVAGWLRANLRVARQDATLWPEVLAAVAEFQG